MRKADHHHHLSRLAAQLPTGSMHHGSTSSSRRANGRGSLTYVRRGSFRAGSRGQILLIAVLVMFAVASLAALFTAIVGSQVVQVTRYADVTELRQAAESALRYANEQLTYSQKGADWRPGLAPYRCGSALVNLTVAYTPDPAHPSSRFLGVTAVASFRDNPFLKYTVLGLKPLLLTDYARFITDRYEARQPAVLGVTGVEVCGVPRNDPSTHGTPYQFEISGPIRSNTDLLWYGSSRVDLFTSVGATAGPLRDDRIEITGWMKAGPESADQTTLLENTTLQASPEALKSSPLQLFVNNVEYTPQSHNLFAPANDSEQWGYANGYSDMWSGTSGFTAYANAWRVLAALPPYKPDLGSLIRPPSYAVPRIEPPRMDAVHPEMRTNRYLMLTRDSGQWVHQNPADTSTPLINTGASGWGWTNYGGIYIDNTADIQYHHDLEKLRENWTGGYYQAEGGDARPHHDAETPADWWDKTGHYYLPPGVEIILHGDNPCPYIELRRDDLKQTQVGGETIDFAWRDKLGNPVPIDNGIGYARNPGECPRPSVDRPVQVTRYTAQFPFPPNGVIYAEGNARVRGVMPPETNDTTYWTNTFDGSGHRSRRFDLTIVSGGTIYIEGDILTADRVGLLRADQTGASAARVALIARDNVCLNTTALLPRPANLFQAVDGNYYNDAQPVFPSTQFYAGVNRGFLQAMWFRGQAGWDPNAWNGSDPLPTDPPGIDFLYWNPWVANQATRTLPGVADLRLMLGHGAWFTRADGSVGKPGENQPDNSLAQLEQNAQVLVDLKLSNAGLPLPGGHQIWHAGTELAPTYTFMVTGSRDNAAESGQWYQQPEPTLPADNVNHYLEWLPDQDQHEPMPLGTPVVNGVAGDLWLNGILDTFTLEPYVLPVLNSGPVRTWAVAPEQLGYLLGPLAVAPPRGAQPMPVEVHALVYAQNGSWFVLPGPWFNEDPHEVYNDSAPQPGPAFHEPLNMRISFYGAISENMPAPVGDVADWTSKWSGPLVWLKTAEGGFPGYLTYTYDPVLHQTRFSQDGRTTYPVFPYLPMTPDMLIWGERVSGSGGAGV